MNQVLKFIATQSKAYPSEIEYYASEDYKKIYPELCRLNRILQAAYAIHHEDNFE